MNFSKFKISVVIPAYRTEREIESVLQGIPAFVRYIIVVDDASPDSSTDLVMAAAKKDKRITLIRHEKNQGVGGAMVTGFKKALELGTEIVIKLDGDGQMDPHYIPPCSPRSSKAMPIMPRATAFEISPHYSKCRLYAVSATSA
jgi:glycosyltransferase involved in cell wall biosynthesis